MGSGLFREAMGRRVEYPQLSCAAYVVLLHMCETALDRPQRDTPARHYYAGWGVLAIALGYPVDESGKPGAAGERAVARALVDLSRARLIARQGVRWHEGSRNAVYVIFA